MKKKIYLSIIFFLLLSTGIIINAETGLREKQLLADTYTTDNVVANHSNNYSQEWITIKNGNLWFDNTGNGVQAHGAGFLQVGDTWYMIGEDRSNSWDPDINMYSSKDFVNWKFENKIIENGKHSFTYPDESVGTLGENRMIERPKLLYCAKTGRYIIWCHWESRNYAASEAAVFYSDNITGPYKLHWAGRPLGIKSRDCNVFQDDNGKAYFISTTNENQDLGLFELSDDYLSAVKHTRLFEGERREAPAVVKVNGTYFMISSACTGWDPNPAMISFSKSLEKGWSPNKNIGGQVSFDTQAASILTIQGKEGTSYIYVGDRWQDPRLPESKTIMFPIEFNGNACVFDYRQQFDLNMKTGRWRETNVVNRVPKANWKIRAFSSEETDRANGAAVNAIDGDVKTIWHTKRNEAASSPSHSIEVDMGTEYEISGFLCTPRLDSPARGLIRDFILFVSPDGQVWEPVAGGGWLPYASEVYFEPARARYFRMVSLSGNNASIAELDMLTKTTSYAPLSLTPYVETGGERKESSDITVNESDNLKLVPTVNSRNGTWAFYGPGNHVGAKRDYEIENIKSADAGVYTFFYLDSRTNQVSKQQYTVSVTEKK